MGVGARLRAARIAAGLDLSDIAADLRLRETQVQAIEDEYFTLCGGQVYARGHVRSIARLLDLDPEELVEQLDQSFAEDVPRLG
jgi:cytoskeleton protein RodZ